LATWWAAVMEVNGRQTHTQLLLSFGAVHMERWWGRRGRGSESGPSHLVLQQHIDAWEGRGGDVRMWCMFTSVEFVRKHSQRLSSFVKVLQFLAWL